MLRQLRIQNFKIWKDTGNIQMAPITLFFGSNSSGKSSIGQFLMMLKQTVEYPDRKAVFYSGGRNSAVQLGSYPEMVFHHDPDNNISFEYQWDLQGDFRKKPIKDPITGQTYAGDTLKFEATVGLKDKQDSSPVVDRLKYQLMENGGQVLAVGLEHKTGAKSEYKANAEHYDLLRKQGRAWSLKNTVRFYGFPDEVVAYYQNADFVQELNLQHEKLFQSLCYIVPLRTKTERLYTWGGVNPESVGYSGENTVAAILAARNRRINLGRGRPTKTFEAIIALKLKDMGLIEEFRVNPISEQRQEYEVKVQTKGSMDWVDLPDVGFGVSQVLPVLVQCFYAPRGSIILMEQPEIHLHPSAQSALADVIIDVINSREDGIDRGIQLIIETHSEHFLRRLQRRIAEDVISEEKVSAYFADITKMPASLEPLKIDLFGSILNWPENFFGDDMGDITGQAKAAMKKRMSQSSSGSEVSK
jgi:predicted ATPase